MSFDKKRVAVNSIMLLVSVVSLVPTWVLAEPVGRWWAGFGQGTFEYGIKNDSAGSDAVYIACAPDTTYVNFSVGGSQPKPDTEVLVVIGRDEFILRADELGHVGTKSHVESDNFIELWRAMRAGRDMRVRLSTGETTVFTLDGSSRALGEEPCETDFAR